MTGRSTPTEPIWPGQTRLEKVLTRLCRNWEARGLFARNRAMATGRNFLRWKQEHGVVGLWPSPPAMMTATLDDGLGMGLDLIELYAAVAGLKVKRLGLLLDADTLIQASRIDPPDLLGLTVLHEDTRDLLETEIMPVISSSIVVLVGGPAFKTLSPDERREKPYTVTPDLTAFVRYLLTFASCGFNP